jgi:peroxiredoxin
MCMIELGELEAHQAEFAQRHTRLVVASADDRAASAQTQEKFPHLVVLSDPDRALIGAAGAVHPGASPDGQDVAAPTTFLLDRDGQVRWVFRPDRAFERLSPADLLAAVDAHLPANR